MIKDEIFCNVVPYNPPEGVFINNSGWFREKKDNTERRDIINMDFFMEVPYISQKGVSSSGFGRFYEK